MKTHPAETRLTRPMAKTRPAVTLALACAIGLMGFLPVVPHAAAQQPISLIPVAALTSDSGAATLWYDSNANLYHVTWTLQPGELDTEGSKPGPSGWGILTVLWDDNGQIIGCYNTGDQGLAYDSGNPLSGSVVLTGCVDDSLVPRTPTTGLLHWSFFGGFVSSSSSVDWVGGTLKWGLVAAAVVLGAVIIAIACANVETGGTSCALATYAVGIVVGAALTAKLDAWCEGSRCTYRTATTLLNQETAIDGIPSLSLSVCEGSGHDTWNIIEETFYNRQPGMEGLGVTYPYDAANYCIDGHAENAFLGLAGTVGDDIDLLLRSTVVIGGTDGDGPNTYIAKATDAHHYEYGGVISGDVANVGHFNFDVQAKWDYEWAGESKQRTYEATNYEYTLADDPNCPNCGSPTNSGGYDPTHLDAAGSQDTLVDYLSKAWKKLDDPFDSPNPMVAEGTAKGLLGSTTAHKEGFLQVHFDVLPRVDCAVDCPDGGIDAQVKIHPWFFQTFDIVETELLIQDIRAQMGEHQKVFVLVDDSGIDWDAYAAQYGYDIYDASVAPAGRASSMETSSAPLVTIVQSTMALPE